MRRLPETGLRLTGTPGREICSQEGFLHTGGHTEISVSAFSTNQFRDIPVTCPSNKSLHNFSGMVSAFAFRSMEQPLTLVTDGRICPLRMGLLFRNRIH